MVNKMFDAWNKIEMKVPSVTIPMVGTVGGFSISLPKIANIPFLADGGIVSKPTLAMIGEGGESEAVIPLSKLSGLTGGKTANIYVELDGQTIARAIGEPLIQQIRIRTGMAI
jgi:hypothetical protein